MTRKDFELVAWTLKRTGNESQNWQAVSLVARGLATSFGLQHPRFKRATFFIECGLALDGTPR
jgi:hypothetical protein